MICFHAGLFLNQFAAQAEFIISGVSSFLDDIRAPSLLKESGPFEVCREMEIEQSAFDTHPNITHQHF